MSDRNALVATLALSTVVLASPPAARAQAAPFEGRFIKGSRPEVYLVRAGQRRWITGPECYFKLAGKRDFSDTTQIPDAELAGITEGPPITCDGDMKFINTPALMQVDARRGVEAVTLAPGEVAVVSAAGRWRIDSRNLYGTFDANGTTSGKPTEPCALVPSAPMGALVGSLDGKTWFRIGAGPTTVTGPGTLQLAANDCTGGPNWPYFSDNAGMLAASVTTQVVVDARRPTRAVTLTQGQRAVMSAAGRWRIDSRNLYGTFDANGTTSGKPTEPCALVPSAPMGTLVGSLDGGKTWFRIGAGPTTIIGPGALQLAANDCTGGPDWPYFSDNGGTLTVTLAHGR